MRLTIAQRLFQSPVFSAAYNRLRESPASWMTCGMTFTDEARRHSAALATAPGGRFLEVACGQGSFGLAALHALPGAHLVGLDLSAAQLGRAAAKVRRRGMSRRHLSVRGDALRLPFADRSFDGVLCVGGLHQIPDPSRAIDETTRVLVSRGVLVGATFVLGRRWAEPAGMNAITPLDVRRWLEAAGLHEVRLDTPSPIWCVLCAAPSGGLNVPFLIDALTRGSSRAPN